MRTKTPKKKTGPFSNSGWSIKAMTVGDMIEELQKLPPDMSVELFPSQGVDLVVFNRGMKEEHLGFKEAGSWSEDFEGKS